MERSIIKIIDEALFILVKMNLISKYTPEDINHILKDRINEFHEKKRDLK